MSVWKTWSYTNQPLWRLLLKYIYQIILQKNIEIKDGWLKNADLVAKFVLHHWKKMVQIFHCSCVSFKLCSFFQYIFTSFLSTVFFLSQKLSLPSGFLICNLCSFSMTLNKFKTLAIYRTQKHSKLFITIIQRLTDCTWDRAFCLQNLFSIWQCTNLPNPLKNNKKAFGQLASFQKVNELNILLWLTIYLFSLKGYQTKWSLHYMTDFFERALFYNYFIVEAVKQQMNMKVCSTEI